MAIEKKTDKMVVRAILAALLTASLTTACTSTDEADREYALRLSEMQPVVQKGDIKWIESQSEASGITYRFLAIIPSERMNPKAYGIPDDVETFVVRKEITGIPENNDKTYRTIVYFRSAANLAHREVQLTVGVSTVERALAR
ncbi:hypothetical protein HWD35_24040 [Tsukamurella tyrosinosolvens]|uniref:hypothetical protein n=1 Tax=Tsukamurella tyrosinosolvens TaxID=57704 RepID=UPI001146F9EB|nr:hypothetical protein [Tsukamurella tyrosinosolvens]MCA4997794.1 hypothetical protein [Tsukamurella tyrosinosolvens]QRY85225.1 hypothetical protein JVY00_03770 [Tsukamurella tyrosinosolvens]